MGHTNTAQSVVRQLKAFRRRHGLIGCLTSLLWDVYQRFGGVVPDSEFGTTPPGTAVPPAGSVSRQAQVRWCQTMARTKAESCASTVHVSLHRCGTCIRGSEALSQTLNLGQHLRGPPYPLRGVCLDKHRSDGAKRWLERTLRAVRVQRMTCFIFGGSVTQDIYVMLDIEDS